MPNICLPVSAVTRNGRIKGTCFFFRSWQRNLYLITTAHLMTGDLQFSDTNVWPTNFMIHRSFDDVNQMTVNFITGIGGGRQINAGMFTTHDGVMADVVAIPLNEDFVQTLGVRVFDAMEDTSRTEVGDILHCHGFPRRLDGSEFYFPESVSNVTVTDSPENGSDEVHGFIVKGYSGGPVVNSAGRLVAMCYGGIEEGRPINRILPVRIFQLAAV
jgi:hypothetical protein